MRVLVFLVVTCLCMSSAADQFIDRRVQIALSIFPRVVAVDNHFSKKLQADKSVLLIFLYSDQKNMASQLVLELLNIIDNLGGRSVHAKAQNVEELVSMGNPPTAIFLAQKFSSPELDRILKYASKNGLVVFSPFVGDVERGVPTGIEITNRVRPYFNVEALRKSGIEINALLLGMSKRYE